MSTVLIIGATSDIGFAIAKKFASEKYGVQLASRNVSQLEAFQSDISIRYGVPCTTHAFDAADFASHRTFFESLSPRPDVSIYVSGYMNDNEKVIKDWNEASNTVNVNYTGAISILNIIAESYTASQSGTIVGISSVAGNRGRQSNYIYGSAKAGFTAYLSGLRNKLYHSKVHVLTVLPGFVNTRMTENLNLPKLLTAQPDEVGTAIYKAVKNKKDVLYVKWFWRWIMLIITTIPESMFKKRKL